jgi:hypothetical protein
MRDQHHILDCRRAFFIASNMPGAPTAAVAALQFARTAITRGTVAT